MIEIVFSCSPGPESCFVEAERDGRGIKGEWVQRGEFWVLRLYEGVRLYEEVEALQICHGCGKDEVAIICYSEPVGYCSGCRDKKCAYCGGPGAVVPRMKGEVVEHRICKGCSEPPELKVIETPVKS